MALAALAFSQSLPHRSPFVWSSNAPLWRFFYSRLVRQKQEVRDFHLRENGVLFLSLDSTRHHQQREPHFLKKSQMSSVLVSQSRGLMLTSCKQEQNQRLEGSAQELIYETATQALLASNLEETGKPIGKNAEEESNVDTAKNAPLVYRRRSKKNMVEKEILVMKDVDIELKHSIPSQVRTKVVATKDLGKNSRKRREVKRSSQHIDVESLEKTSDFSQCTEADTVTNTQKKRVTAKTSQQRDGETSPGSQKSRKTAKTFQHTESDMISAKDSQCKEKVSGSRKRKTTNEPSPSVDATCSEKHEVDILIKQMDPWLLLAHKKVQTEWITYNPLTMRQPNPASNSLKLLSWNVNGLRALLKGKGDQEPGAAILKLAQKEDFDVLSLQETKLQEKDVLAIKEALLPGYDNSLWSCSTAKLGYSGTAVISRIKPLSVSYGLGIPNHDSEGRVITVEFERFFLVTSYVPNSGQKLERLAYRTEDWDSSFGNFIKTLEKTKPVILTGDLNCAHQEIDIYNPDGNRRSAGFTNEERASFEKNFLHGGLTDTFRRQHPNTVGYTYWGYRTAARPKNQGWRLDYFLVSDALLDLVHDSYILPDVEGSDHCPIGLTLKMADL